MCIRDRFRNAAAPPQEESHEQFSEERWCDCEERVSADVGDVLCAHFGASFSALGQDLGTRLDLASAYEDAELYDIDPVWGGHVLEAAGGEYAETFDRVFHSRRRCVRCAAGMSDLESARVFACAGPWFYHIEVKHDPSRRPGITACRSDLIDVPLQRSMPEGTPADSAASKPTKSAEKKTHP